MFTVRVIGVIDPSMRKPVDRWRGEIHQRAELYLMIYRVRIIQVFGGMAYGQFEYASEFARSCRQC